MDADKRRCFMEEWQMIASSVQKVAALLVEAGKAHHEYEQRVLQGVYDRDWAIWYAEYTLDRGLNKLLVRSLTLVELGQLLSEINQQYEAENSPLSWAEYTAQKILQ
jgi:hypothetical protein